MRFQFDQKFLSELPDTEFPEVTGTAFSVIHGKEDLFIRTFITGDYHSILQFSPQIMIGGMVRTSEIHHVEEIQSICTV